MNGDPRDDGGRDGAPGSTGLRSVAPALRRSPLDRAHLREWLRPGMGVKRWIVVSFLGLLALALGGSIALRQFVREVGDDPATGSLVDLLTLQWLPPLVRVALLLVVGVGLFLWGARHVLEFAVAPLRRPDEPLLELIYQKRSLARGPRIVAIGGGTGLSTLLRGLKAGTSNLTAVVTVADDGGSSGVLREELGIPPVGDIRNCIAALADAEPIMTELLQHRFESDGAAGTSLRGHAFGNLLIAALSAVSGDFEEGVRRSNRVLAVRGRVVPAAPVSLTLHAELADGQQIRGQSRIAKARGIRRVWISPAEPAASRDALDAIASADLIVLGPGSLYTSLLPSLLIPQIRDALARASAPRLYVANVATQAGETEGYTLAAHLAALSAHGLGEHIDVVLANDDFSARVPPHYAAAPVRIDLHGDERNMPRLVLASVVDAENAHHHDPEKLAAAVLALAEDRTVRRIAPVEPIVARSA